MSAEGGSPRLPDRIERIGVVLRRRPSDERALLERLQALCDAKGVSLHFEENAEQPPPEHQAIALDGDDLDLVLSLGGDGTLLRAARFATVHGLPVVGINVGHLGFLTSLGEAELEGGLESILAGDYDLERRFTLEARILTATGTVRATHMALNDFVLHTSGAARVTPLHLQVSREDIDEEIGSFAADGVILATPTGSTAYSMSAGGPIVVPEVECIVVTAICPHSLAVRPLVVPAWEKITVKPMHPDPTLQLTVDGQVARRLESGDRVQVLRGDREVRLVRMPGQTFFRTMRRKLNWAARPPERA